MIGFITIHRALKGHWIWSDPIKFQWWISILMDANFTESKALIKGQLIACKRGQTIKSLDTWAKEWRTTKKTVQTFFKILQSDGMVKTENMIVTTRLTVCKYEDYQNLGNAQETHKKRKVNAEETQPTPIQQGKQGKEDKQVEISKTDLFEIFWDEYGHKVGKDATLKKWMKIDVDLMDEIIKAVPCYVVSTPERKFRKHPSTWLHGKHWEDDLHPPPQISEFIKDPQDNSITYLKSDCPNWSSLAPFDYANYRRYKNGSSLRDSNNEIIAGSNVQSRNNNL